MSTITVNEVANITVSNNSSIFSLIASADIVSKSVMLLLIIVSIWSWTIIFDKTLRLIKIKKKITAFEAVFWSGQILDQLYENIKNAVDNPLSAIFVGAMHECKRSSRKNQTDSFLKIGQKERILQSMHLIRDRELEKLETNLTFLATVGSSATFIGLFGTVWGIMHSFQSIAASKNTSLAVVAPGIAEALLATAIGLLAAIPAVIFHSYLMNKVISISNKMDDFVGELNTLLSRAIDEEKI
ncbi:protein TolQ [Candidatus Trichorickettsia mobilis]|uniref:protein TolQ n=1 Tax=Candidatus Trichorickettsia mobilis TaxID=1346319 RepID=UPI00292ECA4A|nr:protein TolQ [Candidatus Trichorickettsia mobilis]